MSEEKQVPAEETQEAAPETPTPPAKDPVKTLTRNVFIVVAIIFVWYLFADRHTPWTDQARVQAYVIPIVPQVAGKLVEVNVTQDQGIERGDKLFSIDPSDYLLAVETAETQLELAGQDIGAGTANVATAQAQLVEAQTNLEHINAQSARVFELEQKKLFSKSEGDKARAAIKQARAQVRSAQANLEKAKSQLGAEGEDNPKIRAAMAQLQKAQLDLSRTTVLAPTNGGITNLQVDVGYYANPGQPVMTFVDADDVWVEVYLKENNLANLKVGDDADIVLDVLPGRIFKGKVRSIGFAVQTGSTNQVGGLVSVKTSSGWLRDPQRFPVIVSFEEEVPQGLRRVGGQADVQLYTGSNFVLNAISKVYIRLLSWISYVY
ncbi:membrane fusion protein [Vibrio ishigakensis]|uniref:Membrane fusion protein n=2 Tax=Vibrio ishigakensis TaxID=1481914 RepID=A0A0B8QN46_9VIBR|nr:membrane fusion protein [Vibrio ishigakensis]